MIHTMSELDLAHCERLLEKTPVGRVAFDFAGAPMMLPIAYRYVDGKVVFRTSTGLKLNAIAADHPVAFEIDSWDAADHTGWSVLITGSASEITVWEQLQFCKTLDLGGWVADEQLDRWIEVIPSRITGRRIT